MSNESTPAPEKIEYKYDGATISYENETITVECRGDVAASLIGPFAFEVISNEGPLGMRSSTFKLEKPGGDPEFRNAVSAIKSSLGIV